MASSLIAAANSFNVLRSAGAPSTRLSTAVEIAVFLFETSVEIAAEIADVEAVAAAEIAAA